jgi:hypothetical protein
MYPPLDQSAANGGCHNIAKNIQQPLVCGAVRTMHFDHALVREAKEPTEVR